MLAATVDRVFNAYQIRCSISCVTRRDAKDALLQYIFAIIQQCWQVLEDSRDSLKATDAVTGHIATLTRGYHAPEYLGNSCSSCTLRSAVQNAR